MQRRAVQLPGRERVRRRASQHLYREVPGILIDLANARGGDDNITVVLIHIANDVAVTAEPTRTNERGEGRVVIGNQPPAPRHSGD